jgi:HlyD family secretion protein
MRSSKILFALALLGILAGGVAVHLSSVVQAPRPALFPPPADPYAHGIYAEGIVESLQSSGQNVNVYPEVSGTVTKILVAEGHGVRKGEPLVQIDDSIQAATVEQQKSAAQAALAMLQGLKAEPRKEKLDVAQAQVAAAQAVVKTAQDAFEKQDAAFHADPRSVSRNDVDVARDTVDAARANLEVARRQLDLTKAGVWSFDIRNQERQYNALEESYLASRALLARHTLRAPEDGVVLSINTAMGSYISPQGTYDSYTHGMDPVLVLGAPQSDLAVRCYIDEILIPRLPAPSKIKAQMSIRGSNVTLPLEFVRVQPYVSPKIELSNQRQERVDVRVFPMIFKFKKPKNVNLFPGELVDVYIRQ